jgi:tungstate transport system substrate-binding protein
VQAFRPASTSGPEGLHDTSTSSAAPRYILWDIAVGTNRAAVAVVCMVLVAGCRSKPDVVRMATTTSVENSGLLTDILPAFSRQTGITVDVLPVGSGQALNLLKRGEVAVGLTHDPAAEAAALAGGAITGYRKIMFNDFIIAGPSDDPAGVARASDAVDAFARIAASDVMFASRGDSSGTYTREQELWALAKRRPAPHRLLDVGQGMGGTLRVANEKSAYTLSDRATFEQFRSSLRLTSLFQGGSALLNTYAVFVRPGLTGTERAAALALTDWLADGDGRHLIAGFVANGQTVFRVWPPGTPRESPADLPPLAVVHAR